jgi:PKD repeat protein
MSYVFPTPGVPDGSALGTMWMGYGETDTRFPNLGTGGAPTGGPRYDFDPDSDSPTKFPAAFDGQWFIGEWNNGWIKQATLNDSGEATDVQCWVACSNTVFPGGGYKRPHELEFGPDGSLYVIEWGSGFGGNNADSGIYRIDYTKGARKPIAHASADPSSGVLPLEVHFSADGSVDPEGTSLTYAWDFDGNGTTDSTEADPVHTYTTPGTFQARLTVTDASGLTGSDTVPIIAGNSMPQVNLILPENGKVADFGDLIPYEIEVTDAEDGSTGAGTIDCDDVTLNVSLGHDQHAHELAQLQGCEGTFRTNTDGGHGAEANIFLVVEATYTDGGATGGVAPVTGRAEAILQPRLKQAEYFVGTGRTADGRGTDAAGVQNETTTDAGGGQAAAFIQDGDWVSYSPYNLEDLDSVTYRVASGGAGGTIELRVDAPDGPLVATSPTIAATGGWQNFTDVTVDLPDALPQGTHTLYLVFRHPTSTSYLFNLNWFRFAGKGAAVSAPPSVTATATPTTGTAPLDVAFDSTAADPEGGALTYEWDFGAPGSGDTSTQADPQFTYDRAGSYLATVTVTDPSGQRASATVPVTVTGGGGECPSNALVDEFDGSQLGADWTVIRPDQLLSVSGGALRIPAQAGDIYGTGGDAKNLVVRDAPDGAWSATTKIDFVGAAQYHQAGLIVYGDDDNFTKFGRLTTNTAGSTHAEKFEFIYENAGSPRNDAADSTANLAADFPDDYYLRIESDGTNITGAYSIDGTTWTPVGRAAPLPANAKLGLFSFANAGTGNPVAAFDSFTLTGDEVDGGGAAPTSHDDQFDGAALDKTRWNAIVSDVPAEYAVNGGELTISASRGDIYTGDTTPAPNNFILQDAAHAGDDWVIETKVSGTTITGGYAQGGLMARADGDNYVKFDVISDVDQTRLNRIELRSEVAGAIQNPQQNVNLTAEQAAGDIWLRLTKAGTAYTGEYSFDGTTWTAFAGGAVPNAMAAPDFGVFAFSPQDAAVGETVSFDYFLLDGEDPPVVCECESPGDEFDGAELDKDRWNAIVREDAANYTLSDGALRVTTVTGDIYTNGDPSATRNFILQEPPVGDWVIETRVSGTMSGGYEHGGILVRQDDDNYVKFDLISDQNQTIKNRIELRSEVAGAIVNPQPQVTRAAPGYDGVYLRLTKTGTNYAGEWSEDGQTWTSIGQPVANAMADPDFGLFTLGVSSPGGTAVFDYFAVNGETGCEPAEENTAPVLGDVTASPTVGVGPLEVDFTAAATDADDDDLTYSWDFQDDGTADSTAQNPTFTYNTPGTKTARVTVSDGEDEATKTVTVQVLPADDAEADFRVLVFSKTAGFRHSSIDEGVAAIAALGRANGFQVDATEDATAFRPDVLDHYDTVVWLSTTGDVLNAAQQTAFEDYIQAGGGYTGIHSAADTEYGWNWYGHLVGGYFRNHPPGTPTATVHVEDTEHPSTEGLPTSWTRVDEWYNYQAPDNPVVNGGGDDYSVRASGVHVLATVDETTYDEQDGNATDDDHPISWCQRYDGGRAWYTGMGHTEASFTDADYLEHILGGLRVTAGVVEDAACGIEPDTDELDVTAYADPTSGTAPLQVNFSAGVGVPNAGGLQYVWTFPGGDKAYGANVTTTFTTPGTRTVELTVTDAAGAVGTDTVEVTVAGAADLPPAIVEAEADVTSGAAPLEVWFHAVATDPEGKPLTYRWDFGDGGAAFGDEAEHTYEQGGTYTATLTVTDQAGQTATRTFTVTVTNPPANAAPSVEAAATPASGPAPLAVLLTAQGTDPDGDVLTYKWEFGDGSTANGRRVRHTYTATGTFTAKVTATDTAGNSASDTIQVVVGNPAGNQAPTVQAAASKTSGKAPLTVQLTAAGSDPDGDQLAYTWSFGDGGAAGGTKATHQYKTPGTYTATVTVTDAGGKTGTASVTITVTAANGAGANGAPPPAAAAPTIKQLTGTGAKLSIACEASGTAKVRVRVSRKLARKLGLKSRRIALKSVRCVAGQQVTVKVKAGKKARRALKRKAPRTLRTAVSVALDGLEYEDAVVTFR